MQKKRYKKHRIVKTWGHFIDWVIKKNRPVFHKTKSGWTRHDAYYFKRMPVKTIDKLLKKGIFREAREVVR